MAGADVTGEGSALSVGGCTSSLHSAATLTIAFGDKAYHLDYSLDVVRSKVRSKASTAAILSPLCISIAYIDKYSVSTSSSPSLAARSSSNSAAAAYFCSAFSSPEGSPSIGRPSLPARPGSLIELLLLLFLQLEPTPAAATVAACVARSGCAGAAGGENDWSGGGLCRFTYNTGIVG